MSSIFNRKLLARAKKIKLLATDVDGVLTNGDIIILNNGEEVKTWSVKDRMGYAMLKASELPIKTAWITARKSKQVSLRAEDLGIHYLYQRSINKWESLSQCATQMKISPDEIAFIGDDYVDLPCLKRVGLAVSPPQSPKELLDIVHHQTTADSGKGVVREVIELILKSQGAWEKIMSRFSSYFFIAFLSISFLTSCNRNVTQNNLVEKPDQWIEQFTITETSRGLPVWVLNSDSAQIFNRQKKAMLDNIRIQFMNPPKSDKKIQDLAKSKKNQTLAARLVALKGEVQLESKNLTAWGNVEVETEDGTKLFAQDLTYSTTIQKIITQSPVKIIRDDSILIGEGLEASPDLSTIKIYRHQASLHPKKLFKKETNNKN